MDIGDTAPDFSLPGTDGKEHALSDFKEAKALVVVFSCNHCPYVKAYEDRMVAFAKENAAKGASLVAINPNDEANYPQDNFDRMKERAAEKGFPFPYLRDEPQEVTKAYGATNTPHFFVFDAGRKLVYKGQMDDNLEEPGKVTKRFVQEAVDAVLQGHTPSVTETKPVGCSVKWKA